MSNCNFIAGPHYRLFLISITMSVLHYDNAVGNSTYFAFPKFWTNSGFCPPGELTHTNIMEFLQGDAMQMNLLHLSALPKGALTHLRIHWALELVEFEQFLQSGLPIYDFSDLDDFLMNLDTMNFYPVIEFMGNFSGVFMKNPSYNDVIWEDLSYQVSKHYLNMFGAKKVLKWRFETWNEPDLVVYNKLNFTLEDYTIYTKSIQHGLERAASRPTNDLHFPLRGPAGLFKAHSHHPLCWGILEYCNSNITECPFEILTFHRKGNGTDASVVLSESKLLLSQIFKIYPQLQQLPISNDEADPISGWSSPRDFQGDVRYAMTLVNIILEYWSAKLKGDTFSNLETISHDNAFLSYHPHEFSQRTLLAHFRMNNTNPPHSQFIQKPVYSALGMLSRLGDMATDIITINVDKNKLKVLKTTAGKLMYTSWLIMPADESSTCDSCNNVHLSMHINFCDTFVFIIEVIDQNETNPVKVWRDFNSPPFPNAIVREAMRRRQSLKIHDIGVLKTPEIPVILTNLTYPWLMLLRVCSHTNGLPRRPQNLQITGIIHNEVLVTWEEINNVSSQCLNTYEVWFRATDKVEWLYISMGWHLAYPSFQYAPLNGLNVNGFYKVRSVDLFNRTSSFSSQIQYIEI